MTRRERWREERNERATRNVTREFRDRCQDAILDRSSGLEAPEIEMLSVVTRAWSLDRPVMKRDLDRAAGVLGRLGAKP